MSRRTLSLDELKVQLADQLSFLESSCELFDQGKEAEAVRLATTLRVLLYDTSSSRSLLGQLGLLNQSFLDTTHENEENNLDSYGGLIWTELTDDGARHVAMLDDTPYKRHVAFADWWDAPVFKDVAARTLSRKDLVRIAANQDGGAHVDPAIDEAYAALFKDNSLGWFGSKGGKNYPILHAVRAALRQIAHEVLKTLQAEYSKLPQRSASPGVLIGGGSLIAGPVSQAVPIKTQKVRRNASCPCGSGIKYKKCHGRSN